MKRTTIATLFTTSALPALLAIATAPAAAQNTGVLNACVDSGGTLRLVGATGRTCRSNETLVSWNIQGPAGPTGATGPRGPAGPQTVLGAVINPDGTVLVSSLPQGVTLTSRRTAAGSYDITINGLGTACPAMTATAFANTPMYYAGGSCNVGFLNLAVRTGNAADALFMINAIGVGAPQLANVNGQAAPQIAPAATIHFGHQ